MILPYTHPFALLGLLTAADLTENEDTITALRGRAIRKMRPQLPGREAGLGGDKRWNTGNMSEKRTRMSGVARREQLVTIGRSLFAARGFDATSVEEIAAKAKVSKPVVYEHFGGKEGLYAVIVDREVQALISSLHSSLESSERPRILLENATLALLDYIESHTDGFRVLVRDAPNDRSLGSFSSVMGDVASRVEHLLAAQFERGDINPALAPLYAQMLVGLIAQVGQWWLDERRMKKDEVAAHVVNLVWNGVRNLRPSPQLVVRN